jgi:hypothetical protein
MLTVNESIRLISKLATTYISYDRVIWDLFMVPGNRLLKFSEIWPKPQGPPPPYWISNYCASMEHINKKKFFKPRLRNTRQTLHNLSLPSHPSVHSFNP